MIPAPDQLYARPRDVPQQFHVAFEERVEIANQKHWQYILYQIIVCNCRDQRETLATLILWQMLLQATIRCASSREHTAKRPSAVTLYAGFIQPQA